MDFMEEQIRLWKVIRSQILSVIHQQELNQLYMIPPKLSNHLMWIFGHIVRTRDFLLLQLANQNMNFPSEWDPLFAKGSSPSNWNLSGDHIVISHTKQLTKEEFFYQLVTFEEQEFRFLIQHIRNYPEDLSYSEPYQTSTGYVVDSIKKAFDYNLMHESIHLGQIQLYSKLIS